MVLITFNIDSFHCYNVATFDYVFIPQENTKLKDENVNLTRENETLRLEIAQRSPKK